MSTPKPIAISPSQRLKHTISLLKIHYPHWSFQQVTGEEPDKKQPSPSLRASVDYQDTASTLTIETLCPQQNLASKTAGMGRPDPNYPGSLWPIQVAMAVAFCLHSFNWPIRLKWPSHLICNGKQLGKISCDWTPKGLRSEILLNMNIQPPSSQALPLTQLTPALLQSVVSCLESPWPRPILFKTFRNWCDTLQPSGQQDWNGGTGHVLDMNEQGQLLVKQAEETLTLDPIEWSKTND